MIAPLLKTLVFVLVVPGTVVGWAPYAILRWTAAPVPPFGVAQTLALGLALFGAAIALPAMIDFAVIGRGTPLPIDPPKVLVVQGPYRYTRNPMYVGIGAILAAEALFFDSWALLGHAAVVVTFFHLFAVLYEEPKLQSLFGAEYEAYRRQVPRWFGPRWR